MGVATFEGIVENGQIRISEAVRLPERTKVYVIIPDTEFSATAYVGSPRLVRSEQAADFKKIVVEDATDAGL